MKFRFLALAILVGAASVGSRLAFVLPFTQEQVRALVDAQQLALTAYVARDIEHSIVARRALIGELAGALPGALLGQPSALSAWLDERQRVNPLFSRGLRLFGLDGARLLMERDAPVAGPADVAGSAWFDAARGGADVVMSAPQRLAGGEPAIIMAAPVRGADGRVLAVLGGIAALDAPGFLDRLQDEREDGNGFLLVSPADRLFVGASEPDMVLRPTPPDGVNSLHDRAMAGYRGSGVTVNAKGVEELASIVGVPTPGWFLVARIPTVDAFRPIAVLRKFILMNLIVFLAGLLALLLFVLPRILRPLTDAARAMREMADGERELAPLPVTRKDEIGNLLRGFNYLVARLREKEAALLKSEARMEFMAHHDPLTGLCNRAMLEDRLQQALARAERDGSRFALLFFDLDGFKPVNDEHGHALGDAVLVEVGARLRRGRRAVDTVARLGGDEFVILLADLDDPRADAGQVAAQCLAALCAPFALDGKVLWLSASVGVAAHPGTPVSSSQLLSQADIAMYRAKRAGKNAVCLFDEADVPRAGARSASAA